MKYQLKSKNYNCEPAETILNDLLISRGITEPVDWMNPDDRFELNPFIMSDMGKALNIFNNVLKGQEPSIGVIVDSDVDGYMSGAIIIKLLKNVNKPITVTPILHPGKEHGIILEELPEDLDLLIVPDAGSSDKEQHIKLLNNGIKIIILDHHEYDNDLDYGNQIDNIAIVNTMRDNYPNPALSGAGVALKFAKAYYEDKGIPFPMKLYSLAACGLISDVMDISALENKYIIDTGLKYMTEDVFLYELIKKAHYNIEKPKPSIKDVGWVIGPNINSIIRLGTLEQKAIILKAMISPLSLVNNSSRGHDGEQIPAYVEAVKLCNNAKKRQTTAVNKCINIISKDLDLQSNNIVYVDENQELNFELSGLIANKLLSEYNRPVILLRHYTDGKDIDQYRGSIRGKAAVGFDSFKDTLQDISGVSFVQGHAFAAGIGIERDMLAEFKAHLNEVLAPYNFNENVYNVELESSVRELNIEAARIFGRDDIWCHGVEKPNAVITDIPSTNYQCMGTELQHVKIDCGKFDVVIFNDKKLSEALQNGEKYNLSAVGEFDIDKSYNIGRLQFVVKEYELKEYTDIPIWDYVF